MKNDIVIYTAISGQYDSLKSPLCDLPFCDLVCFTDDPTLQSDHWAIRYVPSQHHDKALWNRRFKMLPHAFFPEYRYSLYLDGNITLLQDPVPLINKIMENNEIAITKHPERDCVYDELKVCLKAGLISQSQADHYKAVYNQSGFPNRMGLFENNLIVRAHNNPNVVNLMEMWWKEYQTKRGRDQLSLVFLAWQNKQTIFPITCGPRVSRQYFKIGVHEKGRQSGYLTWAARHIRANRHLNIFFITINKLIDILLLFKGILKKR